MNEVNNWQKLITLPKGVVKEQGRFTGEYDITIPDGCCQMTESR